MTDDGLQCVIPPFPSGKKGYARIIPIKRSQSVIASFVKIVTSAGRRLLMAEMRHPLSVAEMRQGAGVGQGVGQGPRRREEGGAFSAAQPPPIAVSPPRPCVLWPGDAPMVVRPRDRASRGNVVRSGACGVCPTVAVAQIGRKVNPRNIVLTKFGIRDTVSAWIPPQQRRRGRPVR